MSAVCAHGNIVAVVYESRWQKHWACDFCGVEFIPISAALSERREEREACAKYLETVGARDDLAAIIRVGGHR